MRCGGKGDAIPLIQFLKMPRPVGGVIHLMKPLYYKYAITISKILIYSNVKMLKSETIPSIPKKIRTHPMK
jgi:hypothetical protein